MENSLESFRLNRESLAAPETRLEDLRKTHRQNRRFIRGPIDLQWAQHLCQLPGKSTSSVALAIWYQAGLQKTKTSVKVCARLLEGFGVPKRTFHDAIKRLEEARLIRVTRSPGQCLRISILLPLAEQKPSQSNNS